MGTEGTAFQLWSSRIEKQVFGEGGAYGFSVAVRL